MPSNYPLTGAAAGLLRAAGFRSGLNCLAGLSV